MKLLNFAEEFSSYPFGRDEKDGKHNGAQFRELLEDKFTEARDKHEKLVVVLDNVHGLGGSFVDEAFGKFAEKMKHKNVILSDKELEFRGNSPAYRFYINKIWESIHEYNKA